jgi:cyclic 2,3-diphosphoglycerate synthase
VAAGYLNAFRLLRADLVIVTMGDAGIGWERVRDAVRLVVSDEVPLVPTVLRPRPASDVSGRTVAYFCTAPPSAHDVLRAHLEDQHGARVTHVSGSLSNRVALRVELETIEADVFLVELKAAAVDVVAEFAIDRGADIVLAANDVIPLAVQGDLDELVLEMARIDK